MPGMGIAVVGAAGGCGTTVMTAALAAWGGMGVRRVLSLDGLGGGPHALWGVQVERAVDHLDAVRAEVLPRHVQQIAHRGMGVWDIVAGPDAAAGYRPWAEDHARRLAGALTEVTPWVADLGRGQYDIGQTVLTRATGAIIMAPRSLEGADACQRLLSHLPSVPVVVGAVARPGEDAVSARSMRRLVRGPDIVEVPWDRRAVRALARVAPGRRGLAACAGRMGEALVHGD